MMTGLRFGRRVTVGLTVTGLSLAALSAWTLVDNARRASERRDREAQDVEMLRRQIVAEQAPRRGTAVSLRPTPDASQRQVIRARAALVNAVEARILADARSRTRNGGGAGPIRSVTCRPLLGGGGALPDDQRPGARIGRYRCVAALRDIRSVSGEKVATLGLPYVAALDFRRFSFVYCRNTPAQGERGVARVQVRLSRACLAARGAPLREGYVIAPDRTAEPGGR